MLQLLLIIRPRHHVEVATYRSQPVTVSFVQVLFNPFLVDLITAGITGKSKAAKDHATTLKRWQKIKHDASLSLANGTATISHQHGVGRDHAPYLTAEKGELGILVTSDMLKSLDPEQRMNPGVLIKN